MAGNHFIAQRGRIVYMAYPMGIVFWHVYAYIARSRPPPTLEVGGGVGGGVRGGR